MKNKKPRKPRPAPIHRRADSECPECFGYPYHERWCSKVRED